MQCHEKIIDKVLKRHTSASNRHPALFCIYIYPEVPETFLVSASRTLFPDCGCDGTASVSFTHRQLCPLGVPPEEGSAGVAGDPAVVTACLAQPLVADLTDNVILRVRHLSGGII